MTSPAADKPFLLSIFCLFLLSVCLLDSLCICSCPRRRKAGILPSLEDLLFYTIAEGQEKIPAHKFTTVKLAKESKTIATISLIAHILVSK